MESKATSKNIEKARAQIKATRQAKFGFLYAFVRHDTRK